MEICSNLQKGIRAKSRIAIKCFNYQDLYLRAQTKFFIKIKSKTQAFDVYSSKIMFLNTWDRSATSKANPSRQSESESKKVNNSSNLERKLFIYFFQKTCPIISKSVSTVLSSDRLGLWKRNIEHF